MKIFKLLVFVVITIVFVFNSTQWSVGNSGGAVAARTGAPTTNGGTELTCQACHGGSLNTGPNQLSLTIADNPLFINAGQVYSITVALVTGTNPRGFQITALDENNLSTGIFIAGSTNKIVSVSASGRQYVTHNSSTNQNWTFTWTAPQTLPQTVTFYLAGGTRNANHTYTLSKAVPANMTSIEKNAENEGFKIYPTLAENEIFIKTGNINNPLNSWTIVDQMGRTISKNTMNETNFADVLKIELPSGMKAGAYSVIIDGPKGKSLKRFIKN